MSDTHNSKKAYDAVTKELDRHGDKLTAGHIEQLIGRLVGMLDKPANNTLITLDPNDLEKVAAGGGEVHLVSTYQVQTFIKILLELTDRRAAMREVASRFDELAQNWRGTHRIMRLKRLDSLTTELVKAHQAYENAANTILPYASDPDNLRGEQQYYGEYIATMQREAKAIFSGDASGDDLHTILGHLPPNRDYRSLIEQLDFGGPRKDENRPARVERIGGEVYRLHKEEGLRLQDACKRVHSSLEGADMMAVSTVRKYYYEYRNSL